MTNVIVTCVWCSQQNRVPETFGPGKALRCGRCKSPMGLPAPDDADLDLDEDLDDEDLDDEDEAFDIEGGQE
jgi:hypothetical protein